MPTFSELQSSLKAAETMHLYFGSLVLVRQHAMNAFVARKLGEQAPTVAEPKCPNMEIGPESDESVLDQRARALIVATVKKFNGNVSMASKHLGISRTTIYNRLGQSFAASCLFFLCLQLAVFGADVPPVPVTIAPHPRDIHIGWSICPTNEVVGFNLYWFDSVSFHWQWAGFDPYVTEQNTWLSNALPPIQLRIASVGTNLVSGDSTNFVWPVPPPPVTNVVLSLPVMRSTDLLNWTQVSQAVPIFTNGNLVLIVSNALPQEYFSVGKLSIKPQ